MAIRNVEGVTINKLTLEQYREVKVNNQLVDNETYIPTDIEQYVPIYKASEDSNNPIILRNLDSGIYKIYGYFKYYPTYSGISAVDPFAYLIVEKGSSYSYVTLIASNEVHRYKITNTNLEDLEDSGWVNLNDYISYRKVGKIVQLRGSGTTSNLTGTLPSEFRPIKNHVFLIAGSGTYYAKARVTNTGVIAVLGGTGTSTTVYELETSFFIG